MLDDATKPSRSQFSFAYRAWEEFRTRMDLHVAATRDKHYAKGRKIEAIDFIRSAVDGESFCLGAAIKYLARYRVTRAETDLYKAAHFISMAWYEGKEKSNE
jgi:hypothetical protein